MTQVATPSAPTSEHVRNIAKDIIFTLLTCGIYNIYVQAKQINAVNAIIKEQKYSFGMWFLLTLVTCGLYHLYHEYRLSSDLVKHIEGLNENEAILTVGLAAFGMSLVADAIQQSHINKFYGAKGL